MKCKTNLIRMLIINQRKKLSYYLCSIRNLRNTSEIFKNGYNVKMIVNM